MKYLISNKVLFTVWSALESDNGLRVRVCLREMTLIDCLNLISKFFCIILFLSFYLIHFGKHLSFKFFAIYFYNQVNNNLVESSFAG